MFSVDVYRVREQDEDIPLTQHFDLMTHVS